LILADGLSLITWRVIGTKAQTDSFCFSALRQVMLASNRAASEAASESDAPFYERNIGHFIASEQRRMDEIRCHANLYEKPIC
jgi:hypothetical protein